MPSRHRAQGVVRAQQKGAVGLDFGVRGRTIAVAHGVRREDDDAAVQRNIFVEDLATDGHELRRLRLATREEQNRERDWGAQHRATIHVPSLSHPALFASFWTLTAGTAGS